MLMWTNKLNKGISKLSVTELLTRFSQIPV